MRKHVVVVGGGILGCMIAQWIVATSAELKVTIIDKTLLGAGASLYSAGIHFPVGRSARVRSLSAMSANYYAQMLRQYSDLPIYPLDFLVMAASHDISNIETYCSGVDLLSQKYASNKLFHLSEEYLVWRMSNCHVANVYALVQKIAGQLHQQACVLESVDVLKITETENKIQLSLSTGQNITADKVILAPGPWVNEAPFNEYTAHLNIRIKKIVALNIEYFPDLQSPIFFPIQDFFLAPLFYRGHWILSYPCQQWDMPITTCIRSGITNIELQEAKKLLNQYATYLLTSHISSGRVFCDAYSPNREPIISAVGKSKNIIFAGAANGAGYRLAPGIAAEVIKLISEQQML